MSENNRVLTDPLLLREGISKDFPGYSKPQIPGIILNPWILSISLQLRRLSQVSLTSMHPRDLNTLLSMTQPEPLFHTFYTFLPVTLASRLSILLALKTFYRPVTWNWISAAQILPLSSHPNYLTWHSLLLRSFIGISNFTCPKLSSLNSTLVNSWES